MQLDEATRKPRKGDVVEVDIERLDKKGRGRARLGIQAFAVRYGLPGSRIRAQVTRRKGDLSEARLLEVLEPSPHEVPARCDHYGTCGGCSFQALEYSVQLVELKRLVEDALAGQLGEARVEDVLGCEDPWHYRNKMDFTFGNRRWVAEGEPLDVDATFALGLHAPGRFEKVLDVHACAIQFEEGNGILASARRLALDQRLEPWDVRSHEGLLRHLLLRKGFRTGEIMVDLVTSRDADDEIRPYAAALLEAHPEVTTFVQNVNTRPASIAVGEWERVLHGAGVIHERLLDLTFTISANSFFQTNSEQAEKLFAMVREEAACKAGDIVYDLYCGAGAIGLVLAGSAREVLGFEVVEAAVLDARRNAEANRLSNARFVHGDVLAEIAREDADYPRPDICVVDPPRAGLHPKVVPALVALGPRRIVYVSCNVHAAALDLPFLAAGGYALRRIRPVDLFPHTPHVECILTLERE